MNGKKALAVLLLSWASAAYGASIDPSSLLRLPPMPWGVNQPLVGAGLAKSIAFDGSNYVVVLQSSPGNLVTAQFLGPTGTPFGSPINFAETSSPPLVCFNGTNYLIVWADAAANINGQFMDKQGSAVGAPFVISEDADATEPGAIAYDGSQYLAIWEAHGIDPDGISSIHGQFITRTGMLSGDRIQISADSEWQRYPALAFDGRKYVVSWMASAGDTNVWQVKGCFLSTSGAVQPPLSISQAPAGSANSIALVIGRTNYIVAWSREVGPYVSYDYCSTPRNGSPLYTNSWLMIHGRLISDEGVPSGPEFQISPRGPTTHSSAAFDGTNFLVSWIDRLYFGPCGHTARLVAQEITPDGGQEEPELEVESITQIKQDAVFASIFAGGHYVFVSNVGSGNSVGTVRRESAVQPVLQNFTLLASNRIGCQLIGSPQEVYSIEFSTNLVDWATVDGIMAAFPGSISWNDPLPGAARGFYRALSGKFTCIRNQRLILWARGRWTAENNKPLFDAPTMDQLAGPGRYLPVVPQCPHGGTYFIGGSDTLPACFLKGGPGEGDHHAFSYLFAP